MTLAIDVGPLGFLYQTREAAFPGYRPETPFTHANEVRVGRIDARHPEGLSSDIREARMPARFFSATCSGPGLTLAWHTGSGLPAGRLLHALCEGLADARVRLDEPADARAWRRTKTFRAHPDGYATEVHVTAAGSARVDISERYSLFGHTGPMTVYLADADLALQLAEAMSEGMLSLTVSFA
jgi:hypothetical protein